MLLTTDHSMLLVVDVQERLVPAITGIDGVIANLRILLSAARELAVPILASEQYPQGLGPTVAAVADLLPPDCVAAKTHFSCAAEPAVAKHLDRLQRRQVVVAGVEAHVCVLQSALGLAERGYPVFVVADAVASRRTENAHLALARLRQAGVVVVSTEMVVFEWLHRAATPVFKTLSRLIKEQDVVGRPMEKKGRPPHGA